MPEWLTTYTLTNKPETATWKKGSLLIFNGLAGFLRKIIFNSKYTLGHFSFREVVLESTDSELSKQLLSNVFLPRRAQRISQLCRRQELMEESIRESLLLTEENSPSRGILSSVLSRAFSLMSWSSIPAYISFSILYTALTSAYKTFFSRTKEPSPMVYTSHFLETGPLASPPGSWRARGLL